MHYESPGRRKRQNLFEEVMTENFPNLVEGNGYPNFEKLKGLQNETKQPRKQLQFKKKKKKTCHIQVSPHKITNGYLSRSHRAQKGVRYYIQNAETKNWSIKITILQKYSSQMKKSSTFPDKQKLRQFITTGCAL